MLSFLDYVKQVGADIPQLSVQALNNQLNNSFLIIDVRETYELDTGMIPNSIAISRGLLESQIHQLVPEEWKEAPEPWLTTSTIVLYCRSGSRSTLAAKSLNLMGLHKVFSLEGGFNAWKSANYPVIYTK